MAGYCEGSDLDTSVLKTRLRLRLVTFSRANGPHILHCSRQRESGSNTASGLECYLEWFPRQPDRVSPGHKDKYCYTAGVAKDRSLGVNLNDPKLVIVWRAQPLLPKNRLGNIIDPRAVDGYVFCAGGSVVRRTTDITQLNGFNPSRK